MLGGLNHSHSSLSIVIHEDFFLLKSVLSESLVLVPNPKTHAPMQAPRYFTLFLVRKPTAIIRRSQPRISPDIERTTYDYKDAVLKSKATILDMYCNGSAVSTVLYVTS